MASRTRVLPNGIENAAKHKTILPGKPLLSLAKKGISARPALGDRTNAEVSQFLAAKKTVIKKPTTVLAKKTTVPIKEIKKPSLVPAKEIKNPAVPVKEVKKPSLVPAKEIKKPAAPVSKLHVAKPGIKPSEKKTATTIQEKKVENIVDIVQEKKAYSIQHFGLVDENETDPHLVPVYVNDIVQHLRILELEYLVRNTFLESHTTSPRMRNVLVNWLVEVHLNFKMVQETLFLCVSIIDRYLQKNKTIGRETLQLVGVTALLVASKYEETYQPEITDLVYLCEDTFSQKRILQMEQSILKMLDFKFGSPCSLHFLRRFSKVAKVEPHNHILAKYILELSLQEYEFSSVVPSLLAAGAICLSLQLLGMSYNDEKKLITVELYSGYSLSKELTPIIHTMAKMILKAETSRYKAIKNKYATKSYGNISSRTELKNGLIKVLAETKDH